MKFSSFRRSVVYKKLKSVYWRVKALIKVVFFRWACHGPVIQIARQTLRCRNWAPARLERLSSVTFDLSASLAETTHFVLEAPRWVGKPTIVRSGEFPPVLARIVDGAMVTAYSPAVLRDGVLYLPPHVFDDRARVMTSSAGLFQMGKRFAVGKIEADCNIESGILIGGAGAGNWYHFVIECLPKVFLSRSLPAEFGDLPLLVPDECRCIPSFATALELVSDGRPIRYMSQGEIALVRRLVVLDEISIGPFNLASGEWPRIDDYSQHDAVMRAFIADFRSKSLGSYAPQKEERRIFLVRPGERRDYNQQELVEIASRYGFEAIAPEMLGLEEQAKIFADASVVVGPSGAAWVGMLFRKQPLLGLSWLPRSYGQFCAYSGLGGLLGHHIQFIEAVMKRPLKSTEAAYTAEYRVCPYEFENILKKMTGAK